MFKRIVGYLCFFGLLALSYILLPKSFEAPRDQIELNIRNHTVRINSSDDKYSYGCTGTLLSHNFVLTNAHCFPPKVSQVFIRRFTDEDYLPAVIVSSAPKTDLALLVFKGLDKSTSVDFTQHWKLNQDIILYGNPGERDFILGHTKIVGYIYVHTPTHKVRTMLVYPCNVAEPGFSGSGIYNTNGEYLGTNELGQEIPIIYQIATRLAGEPRIGPLCYAIPAKEAIERNLDRPWLGFDLSEK